MANATEPRDTVIKTDQGYISVNYPNHKDPGYMFTQDIWMAKWYTKRGASAAITKLGFGQPEPFVMPEPSQEDIEWMNEIIDRG